MAFQLEKKLPGGLGGRDEEGITGSPSDCLFGLQRVLSTLQASVLSFIKCGEYCFLDRVIIMIK